MSRRQPFMGTDPDQVTDSLIGAAGAASLGFQDDEYESVDRAHVQVIRGKRPLSSGYDRLVQEQDSLDLEADERPPLKIDVSGDSWQPPVDFTASPHTAALHTPTTLRKITDANREEHKVRSSVWASVLNLSNTILGAGVLGLPFAVAKSGIVVGLILFCVFGALSGIGLQLMCFAAREVPGSDFAKMSERTVPRAKTLVDLAVAVKCFGVGTSYMIVAGDLMPGVLNYLTSDGTDGRSTLKDRHLWITVFTAMFILPIVRWKHLDNLKFISTFCLIFFAVVVITIFIYRLSSSDRFDGCREVDDDRDCRATIKDYPSSAKDFLGVLPIYIFGFTCHQNAFAITNELHNNSRKRLSYVVVLAIAVCIVIYASSSWAGYTTFGNLKDYPQDILTEYPENGAGAWLPTIVRMVLAINLSLSYALQCNPCRNSISNLIWKKRAIALDNKQFYLLTYGITLMSWVVAMSVTSLGAVLAIVGATGSTAISYILPGLFYYHLFKDKKDDKRKYVAFALMCLGICIVPFALTMVFWSGEAE